jgi:serine/threonine protein kinase
VLQREHYGKAVDWWSYGTLLYEMLSGLPPYYDRNREKMYQKILYAKLSFKKHMSEEARDVCAGLLERYII